MKTPEKKVFTEDTDWLELQSNEEIGILQV